LLAVARVQVCEPVLCPALPAVNLATITYDQYGQQYGATVEYAVDRVACGGGTLVGGDATRTCEADGSWSGSAPSVSDCRSWWVGNSWYDTCITTCLSAGRSCVDGDWGLHDQPSLLAALEEVGQSFATFCQKIEFRDTSDHIINNMFRPSMCNGNCIVAVNAQPSVCDQTGYIRLCKCS
jgi:hypothetical protein